MLKQKIKTLGALTKIVSRLKKTGKTIVFTNGCFDLLHYGHAQYLEKAKARGDILVVAVNSDGSVKKIKGDKRPISPAKQRIGLIAALESVDYALLFDEASPRQAIKALKPDLLVKGADWKENEIIGGDIVAAYGGKVSTVKLVKDCSTTNLIKKIAERYQPEGG